jgi:arylsulfatase A-like enzyme
MNLVIIISDTLRRDHLGCYGNDWIHTPHLDSFAESCVVFDRAYCASFPTMPMRADLYTGKFTLNYLGWAPLPADEVILPEVLSEAGYATKAVVDTPFYVRKGYGYDRGFRDFEWIRGQGAERPAMDYERRYEEDFIAPRTCAAAERWLERHYQERFFLYVDVWDPHEPWDPPAHYVERYLPKWDGTLIRPPYWYWKDAGLTRKDIRIANACYCGEVTMVDRWVGRLIEKMELLNVLDDTIILFTADHGFHLGEHGLLGKAISKKGLYKGAPLYEEVTRVPFLLHVPGAKARRTKAIIQPPDIMPTVLDLLGVKAPRDIQGISFAPVIEGKKRVGRRFAVTTMPLYNPGMVTRAVDDFERKVEEYLPATISAPPWVLLYFREGEKVELYNIDEDPKQSRNVAKRHPEVVKKLHRRYVNFLREIGTSEELLAPRERL